MGIVGVAAVAGWQRWKIAQKNALPEGIVSGNGRIESVQVDVAAKYGGRIKEILAREGDLVEEGQVLARMDTAELEAELAKGKAKRRPGRGGRERGQPRPSREKESELKLAEQQLVRSQNLYSEEGHLPRRIRPARRPSGRRQGGTGRCEGQAPVGEPVDERRRSPK